MTVAPLEPIVSSPAAAASAGRAHTPSNTPSQTRAQTRVKACNAVSSEFFADASERIARTCALMAARFQAGGRLFVCGDRSDVSHVVVEFLHPVVVGKRALPAIALPPIDRGEAWHTLSALGNGNDLLLLVIASGVTGQVRDLLASARARGMLVVALVGRGEGSEGYASELTAQQAEQVFVVPSADPCIVQETQEIVYHVLWELVHVFFDRRSERA